MSMRAFFFLLVFANLVFFAWSQGHFGAIDESREPERLAQQLQAEKLRILPSTPVATVKTEAIACQIINGLSAAEAEALQSAPAAAGTELKILPAAEPTIHRVAILDLANQAVAERKAAELGRFGVTEQKTVALADGRQEIILGSFETEAAANEFLQGLTKRGIKSARVDSREPTPLKIRVEARAPASTLLRQLPLLIAPHAEATLSECAP
ncbi:MAG: hypothetical protein U1A72_21585 [Sulfuritalea sp.]|nr:hypothetical protein [Sulfuritalea sp.]